MHEQDILVRVRIGLFEFVVTLRAHSCTYKGYKRPAQQDIK
jgi:hypothetical protein